MKVYTVHRRETGSPPDGASAGDLVLVKEGFAWMGAVAGPFWALAHRLWGWALVTALAAVAYAALTERVIADPAASAALGLALLALIGAHANDAWRRGLAARGYRTVAIVAAADREAALIRYIDTTAAARTVAS